MHVYQEPAPGFNIKENRRKAKPIPHGRSLPFLTVNAIFGNQAFSHGSCNIYSGYSEATKAFLNNLRKNEV